MLSPDPVHGSRIPRPLEHLFVWSVLGLSGFLTWRLVGMVESSGDVTLALAAAMLGYVAADFVSGLIHWAFDRMGTEDTPILGHAFIHPFRYHHVDPQDMMNGDFISTNGKNSIGCVPILIAGLWIPTTPGLDGAIFGLSLLVSFILGIWMTNQFHKWAHIHEPRGVIRTLQRLHLVLTPTHHDEHHQSPYQANYCITSGWCNPVLERLRFFPRLESTLGALGVRFNDGEPDDDDTQPGEPMVGSAHGSVRQRS